MKTILTISRSNHLDEAIFCPSQTFDELSSYYLASLKDQFTQNVSK